MTERERERDRKREREREEGRDRQKANSATWSHALWCHRRQPTDDAESVAVASRPCGIAAVKIRIFISPIAVFVALQAPEDEILIRDDSGTVAS